MNNSKPSVKRLVIGTTAAMAIMLGRPTVAMQNFNGHDRRYLTAADRKFVEETAQDQQGDIAMGRLAERRGISRDVRDFGRRQVVDHTRSFDDLRRTVAPLGYTAPEHPGSKQLRMMRELERQHGAAFDRLYRRDMLEDHVSDIEEYRRRMQETRSPAIRRYVERTLPVLRRHLQLAIVMSTKSWAYAHRRYRPR